MFDIDNLVPRHVDVPVVHPALGALKTANGEPVVLVVAGMDGPEWRAATLLNAEAAGQRMAAKRDATAAEILEQRVTTAAACVVGWRGLARAGEPLPYSADAARELLTAHAWLLDVVLGAIGNRASFFTPSAPPAGSLPAGSSS
jgi:hypothetical protein